MRKILVHLILIYVTIISCKEKTNTPDNIETMNGVSYLNDSIFNNNREPLKIAQQDSLDLIVEKWPTFTLDSVKYYLLEGDIMVQRNDIEQYLISKSINLESYSEENKLIVTTYNNGRIIKWPENYIIKYSINKRSFSPENYDVIKNNMILATKDWENTCNVKFQYLEEFDNQNLIKPIDDLTFVVVGINSNGKFIASAFFPDYDISRRRILVDPSYFSCSFNKVGVFRHEIGHILGFRHEQIRFEAPIECQGESRTNTRILTKYDPKSVMHYFCGGMGTIDLLITPVDIEGSTSVYGKPKNR
jgi:hypothetical protein